jgi:hypothetical protein
MSPELEKMYKKTVAMFWWCKPRLAPHEDVCYDLSIPEFIWESFNLKNQLTAWPESLHKLSLSLPGSTVGCSH